MGPFASKKYGILTRKIASWYEDESLFVSPVYPWFDRGGGYSEGTGTGLFTFAHSYGHATVGCSFRIVLSI